MKQGTFSLLLILLLAITSVAESTLLNYEHRVKRAAEQIERIKADRDYDEEGIPYIRRLLPKTEDIQVEDRKVTVDNEWLWTLLDAYTKEQGQQERVKLLNEAGGRLNALDEHLKQAEAKPSVAPEVGDERERLREILTRSEYQPKEETFIGRYVKKALAMIRDAIAKVWAALGKLLRLVFGAGTAGGVIPNLIVVGVIAIALIIAIRMISRIKPRKRRAKKRIVLGEEVEADATPRDLAESALAAARAGDFRSAIRKLYVSLLYELSERRLIELDESLTNHEYLALVSRHRSLVPPMSHLTDRFDYVWYGMFPSSQEDFSDCLARYHEAMQNAQTLSEQKASA